MIHFFPPQFSYELTAFLPAHWCPHQAPRGGPREVFWGPPPLSSGHGSADFDFFFLQIFWGLHFFRDAHHPSPPFSLSLFLFGLSQSRNRFFFFPPPKWFHLFSFPVTGIVQISGPSFFYPRLCFTDLFFSPF